MKTTVKILRSGPHTKAPHIQHYCYELSQGMSVLNVLLLVSRKDPTLRFAHCCDGGCCGICALRCNGRPGLACQLPAVPDMLLEPLDALPVLEDLIADRDAYDGRRQKLSLFSSGGRLDAPLAHIPPEAEERVRTAARCIECLSCLSVCPIFKKQPEAFAGPCHFALIARHVFDSRDPADRRETLRRMNPLLCVYCTLCSQVCPTGADPAELIRMLCDWRLSNGTNSENPSGP